PGGGRVLPGASAAGGPEVRGVDRRRESQRAAEVLAVALPPPGAFLGQFDGPPAGERTDGLGEREPVLTHQEPEGVPADAAPEAVEDPPGRVDHEGRRLLCVERAQALPARAGLPEAYELAHDVDDIDAGAN